MRTSIIFLLSFLVMVNSIMAQVNFKSNHTAFSENWIVGISGGACYLATEVKKDFTGTEMNMNSLPGFSYSLFFNKRIVQRFDLGVEYNLSAFKGFKNNPSNVIWLTDYVPGFIHAPIEYKTKLPTLYMNGRYNFLNFYTPRNNFLNLNAYFKFGVGVSWIFTRLDYMDKTLYQENEIRQPIYVKGDSWQPKVDSYVSYTAGIGLNYQLSARVALYLDATFLFFDTDYLDGVHNFIKGYQKESMHSPEIQNYRTGVYDFVGKAMLSLSYQFDLIFKKKRTNSTWMPQSNKYENEFYYEKRYNRVLKQRLPFWLNSSQ